MMKPHTIAKIIKQSTEFPCDCSLPAVVRELAASHDRLRALARELREAMDDMVSIANDSSGITGWHMNGDVLHWQQCEPLAVMEDLLARPDVKELEG